MGVLEEGASRGTSQGGVIALAVVGSVVGLSLVVIIVAAALVHKRRRSATDALEASIEGGGKGRTIIKPGSPPLDNGLVNGDILNNGKARLLEGLGFVRNQQDYEQSNPFDEDAGEEGMGKINFGIAYNKKTNAIQVNLIQMDLFTLKEGEEFFIRASLLPSETAIAQSKILTMGAKGTTLQLNSTLSFEGHSFKEASQNTLVLHAILANGCQSFGEVQLPLRGVKLGNCPVYWKHLNDTSMKINGRLLMTMCWQPEVCRIKLIVNKAKDLLGRLETLDTYSKISVFNGEETLAARKTTVQVGSMDPEYEESFIFDISSCKVEDLQFDVSLVRLSNNSEVRGRVVLGVSGEDSGFLHFLEMLSKPGYPVPMWHKL